MSARTEFVILNKMKEKGKLSFEDIKRIIDRSVNKTNEFINSMIERGLIEKVNFKIKIIKLIQIRNSIPNLYKLIKNIQNSLLGIYFDNFFNFYLLLYKYRIIF